MAILEVKNMRKSFGKTEVLKDVSFDLEKGQVLSIIGSSGSGKTTLLRCLNFLEKADGGRVFLDGKLFADFSGQKKYSENEIRAMRLNFGLVFQQFNLFPQYSVLKNVTLAPELLKKQEMKTRGKAAVKEEIEKKARDILSKVGLSEKLDNFPSELSGGQQQRVAIARALALEPEILFFDEPTSALDPELTGEILKVIKSLAEQNRTMVIVTHEMSFAAEISDKVIFMDDGFIAEQGSADEIFGNPQNRRLKEFLNKIYDKSRKMTVGKYFCRPTACSLLSKDGNRIFRFPVFFLLFIDLSLFFCYNSFKWAWCFLRRRGKTMVLKIIGIVLLCLLGIALILLVLPFSVMLKKDGENFEISVRFLFIKKNLTEALQKRSGSKTEKNADDKKKKEKKPPRKAEKNSKPRFRRET